ncbi:MAG: hypothetical protein M3R63_09540 [Actinomycetota bacterium]|nr:hypothetical protein [Actinomycetota bacterium]
MTSADIHRPTRPGVSGAKGEAPERGSYDAKALMTKNASPRSFDDDFVIGA